jgi:putative endonuclease
VAEISAKGAETGDSPASDGWYVYVLRCGDGSLYTGVARDVERRLRQHNGELAGGARYTRGRRPVELLWSEAHGDRAAAQSREAVLKRLPRRAKLALIRRGPPALPAD